MKLIDMTVEQLTTEAQSLYQCINHTSFSTTDLINFNSVTEELHKRGYEVRENKTLVIDKKTTN
jgi:hypothetical protein